MPEFPGAYTSWAASRLAVAQAVEIEKLLVQIEAVGGDRHQALKSATETFQQSWSARSLHDFLMDEYDKFVTAPYVSRCPQRHNSIITFRRRARNLFRKTFWLNCWDCDELQGPFNKAFARLRKAQE